MFIAGYLTHFNATKAARDAGYSERTAYAIGHQLLKDIDVSRAVEARIMSADQAAAIITDIAAGNMADLMDISTSGFTLELMIGDPDNPGQMIVNPQTKLIRRIKQKVTTVLGKAEGSEDREIIETELELYSAHEAAKDILKYHGKLIDKTDITSGGEPLKAIDDGLNRAVSTLADALREALSGPDAKQEGALASTEQAAMASASK
jgi:phage terminase small subunit